MLSTICMTCISCKSREWYKDRIVTPNFVNAASARASVSFWSKYMLHKKRVVLILRERCWESLYSVCEVLVTFIRKGAVVKNAHRASTS